jgi:predicted alpha/beta-hydrolase family hydrolase
MNIPAQVANVVIGMTLCAGILCGSLDLVVAGPVAASSAAVATVAPPLLANQPASAPHARAYLFRGALGPIFSRGMDRLTERLEQAGITADVYEFTICRLIAETAMREYRRDPAPIILIGHSMGGYCALKFAEVLQAENIPVSLVVTVDPAHVAPSVPLNVERYINIFLSKSVLGGGDVKPEQGYRGDYASFDLSEQDEVTHINIDKMDSIHQQIVAKTLELATTPAKAEGEAVPIRYVVPPNTAVELWDSGMPVVARSGDTLQKLATLRNLPLWSLTQINRESDSAPLVPGQRVIIPRHIVPPAAVTAEAVSSSVFRRKPAADLVRGEDRFASRKRVKSKI